MLENPMKERWLNLGQKEELGPYTEPPCDNMDLWVTHRMMKTGFEQEHIEESVTRRSYNRLMGTYLILSTKNPQVKVCTIKVKPFCYSDLNSPRPSPTSKVQPPGQMAKEPASSLVSLPLRTSTPQPRPELGTSTPQPRPESGTSTPQPSPESDQHSPTQPRIRDQHSPTQPGVEDQNRHQRFTLCWTS